MCVGNIGGLIWTFRWACGIALCKKFHLVKPGFFCHVMWLCERFGWWSSCVAWKCCVDVEFGEGFMLVCGWLYCCIWPWRLVYLHVDRVLFELYCCAGGVHVSCLMVWVRVVFVFFLSECPCISWLSASPHHFPCLNLWNYLVGVLWLLGEAGLILSALESLFILQSFRLNSLLLLVCI